MKMQSVALLKQGRILLLFAFVFSSLSILAQTGSVTGKVTGTAGVPLGNATVKIKSTSRSTTTNDQGVFSFSGVQQRTVSLVISYVGYNQKDVKVDVAKGVSVDVVLEEKDNITDEVVVTGVFDKRTRMQASVAITTISSKQVDKLVPVSAADLLKNVPGVYVNSSLGEVRNTVYSRGVSVGSNDGASGYYYVSMQEDGLPVTNSTFGNYGPDYFLRADATLGRLEAVRGGTASILGANAPGGIFNYIMKEGTEKTSGEVRTKYGLEGNGKNNFYRADFNVGGPLSQGFYYDLGGFYRYDEGNRNPGYPINKGGQFRANIVKKYKNGSLKVYGKYLNDHNGWFEFTPTVGYTNPKPAAGFNESSSVLIPSIQQTFPINGGDNGIGTYNSSSMIHSIDKSIGATWEQHFGTGWTINNSIRYSDKSAVWNTTAVVYPLAFDDLVTYAILGMLGKPGTYSFRTINSNRELMSVTSFSGYDFNVNHSELPGREVSKNSLFLEPMLYTSNNIKELLDQFSMSKKLKNMSFTLGGFYGHSKVNHNAGSAGGSFGTIQNRPELVNITLTDPSGKINHITNSNGGTIGGSVDFNNAIQSQAAVFFGHNWQITKDLNLDYGIRYETFHVTGQDRKSATVADTTGGLDGDRLTLYDNSHGVLGSPLLFNKTVNTFSYSAGLNYTINPHFALYGRYSQGSKAPDLDIYFAANTDFTSKTLNPIAQKVQQVEVGVKAKTGGLNLFITPFYSLLSNVPNVQIFTNPDGLTSYTAPLTYIKLRTVGVEVEANYEVTKNFNVRGVFTLQKGKAVDYSVWLPKTAGPADDSLVSFAGNETDNLARSIINITASYTLDKFYAQLNWAFIGKRQANVANAFLLPSFSQYNFSAGYNVAKNFQLSFNINNILNKYGVMSWSRPGTFLEALDRQGFTKEMYQEAVKKNTPYSTISIPARSYFLTAAFKF